MRRAQAYRTFASEFLDALQGLVTLKVFGQSKARESRLARHAHELFQSTMWVLATNSLSRGITDIGIALGAAAALALSAYRVSQGLMEFESLIMVLLLGVEIFRPLRELRSLLHDGMLAESAAKQVFSVLESEPLVEDRGKICADKLEASLSFDQVEFAYPDPDTTSKLARAIVHKGLSFDIKAGERIGVVGSSGGGKSTIVRLLLRFYDPQAGVIRIGGKDIRELPLQQLRQQFAVVSQDTHLFHGTVRDNLLLGDPDASEKSLVQAAKSANADEFIRALPEAYDTVIGERGIRVSGGQRQRLAIPRAVLPRAPLLIRQADGVAELFLAQRQHGAAQAHATADMDVDRLGGPSLETSSSRAGGRSRDHLIRPLLASFSRDSPDGSSRLSTMVARRAFAPKFQP